MSDEKYAVEVPDRIRTRLWGLGSQAEDAVEELLPMLAANPLLGEYDPNRGDYRVSVRVAGGEELRVFYKRGGQENSVVRIVQVSPVPLPARLKYGDDGEYGEPPEPQPQPADPRQEEIQARQVADAWQRIIAWLGQHAPASYAALLPGATELEIGAVEESLGVRVPAGVRALWGLCAGVREVPAGGFVLDGWAPMNLDQVVDVHRMQMEFQRRDGGGEFLFWKPSWTPVFSFSPTDTVYGLCADSETGMLRKWTKFSDREPYADSLAVFLEDMADSLDAPSLAAGAKPGLVDGALVWNSRVDPSQADQWAPFTG